jgi:hypothetical protein
MISRLATVKNFARGTHGASVRRHLDDADEARLLKADKKALKRAAARRRAADPKHIERERGKLAAMTEEERIDHLEMLAALDRNRTWTRACVQQRLNVGYRWYGGCIGGELQEAFLYRGLKSGDHPILQAFVSTLPRAAKGLKVGMTKSFLEKVKYKVLGLDAPYVGGNKRVLGWIRIDLDTLFASWGHLYDELLDVLVFRC